MVARSQTIRWGRLPDDGATAVEYALMVGLVALTIVGAVTVFGQAVLSLFQSAVTKWPG